MAPRTQTKETQPTSPSPFVSREELINAITSAKRRKKVLVPSSDYYANERDYFTDEIDFIDPDDLIHILSNPSEYN